MMNIIIPPTSLLVEIELFLFKQKYLQPIAPPCTVSGLRTKMGTAATVQFPLALPEVKNGKQPVLFHLRWLYRVEPAQMEKVELRNTVSLN